VIRLSGFHCIALYEEINSMKFYELLMLMKRTNFKKTETNIFLQTIRGNANAGFDFYVDHVGSNEIFGGHFLRKSYGRL
jgi:hypothetical protein